MKNTFIIITHTDADGHLSGHIASNYTTRDPFTDPLVFYYNFNGWPVGLKELSSETIKGSTVYVTDLSISEELKEMIVYLIENGAKSVIHIDHHTTTMDWSHTPDAKSFIQTYGCYTPFFDNKVSAAYLCWVWSFARSKPEVLEKMSELGPDVGELWDFSDDRCFFKFNIYETEEEYENADEYRVPDIVRYVSDNDIWEHKFSQSKQFATFYTSLEKSMRNIESRIWVDCFNNPRKLMEYCTEGQRIFNIEENRSAVLRERIGYEYKFRDIDFYVMNECMGNSLIFGEEYNNHQAVCKWSYNGSVFTYTMYADTTKTDIDLSKIAEEYGGGGHKGAAGFNSTEFLFGTITTPKKESWFKRLFKKKK